MKYLAISAKVVDADNFVAWFADPLPAIAGGATRAEAIKRLKDMHIDAYFCTKSTVSPKAQTLADVDPEALEGNEEIETTWLELGYINPMAYTLWEAMNQAQIGPSELGRRMNITRAAAHKLLDPNRTSPYSLDTLERIAAALGMQLEPPRFIPSVPTQNVVAGNRRKTMNDWDDLLISGGFAPREAIFAGLTLEQVSARPHEVPHSIYQELWHAAMVLKISLDQGRAALERWSYAEHFPSTSAPANQQEWDDLVLMFMTYSKRAVTLAADENWLNTPEPEYPQSNWRDALEFLAVHTAYHLGKVICLRQVMKVWKH